MFKLKGISKKYVSGSEETSVLQDVNFSGKKGEVISILGPSGSGKTTLLRILSGVDSPSDGEVIFSGDIKKSYVSQEYTLWPHLSVIENLVLVPGLQGLDSRDVLIDEARGLLERFGMTDFEESLPGELSGGQRQRVALLRAVMNKPDVIFLDEVTSALDPDLTKSVLDLVRALANQGYTMVLVTHHLSFAVSVSDRVVFLEDGKIIADQDSVSFFTHQENQRIQSYILDIAKRDDNIEVFKGREQFQAFHMGLLRRLDKGSVLKVAGSVGDRWFVPMGDFVDPYLDLKALKNISWKMVAYEIGEKDKHLLKTKKEINNFRKLSHEVKNPANYLVVNDTVITQIFDDEPTIIQIKNKQIADSYDTFFESLWSLAEEI